MDYNGTTGNGNHSNNTLAEYWVIMEGLAFGAGFGIMGPIRKQAGVDVEAAYMNNNPLPRCNTFILY